MVEGEGGRERTKTYAQPERLGTQAHLAARDALFGHHGRTLRGRFVALRSALFPELGHDDLCRRAFGNRLLRHKIQHKSA